MRSVRALSTVTAACLGTSLRRLWRDRIFRFTTVVLPILILCIIAAANTGRSGPVRVGVVNADAGRLSTALVGDLRNAHPLTVSTYDNTDDLQRAINRNDVVGGLVIPTDFDRIVTSGGTVTTRFISNPADTQSQVARLLVREVVDSQASGLQATQFVADKLHLSYAAAAAKLGQQHRALPVSGPLAATTSDNAFQFAAAGAVVLFMFITALSGAAFLVENRRDRVTARSLTMGASRAGLVYGEAVSRFVIIALQGAFVMLVATLGFGVSWGRFGSWFGLLFLYGLVCVAAAMLMGVVARTFQQTVIIGPILGVGGAMLGGALWPRELVGHALDTVGKVTPQAWVMDGLTRTFRGAPVGNQLLVLAGFVLVLLPLAVGLFRSRAMRA